MSSQNFWLMADNAVHVPISSRAPRLSKRPLSRRACQLHVFHCKRVHVYVRLASSCGAHLLLPLATIRAKENAKTISWARATWNRGRFARVTCYALHLSQGVHIYTLFRASAISSHRIIQLFERTFTPATVHVHTRRARRDSVAASERRERL